MDNVYNRMLPQRAVIVPPPTILKSDEDGNYEVVDSIKNILPRYENVGVFSKRRRAAAGNLQTLFASAYGYRNVIEYNRVLLSNKRPKYVPNSIRNYYAEFP